MAKKPKVETSVVTEAPTLLSDDETPPAVPALLHGESPLTPYGEGFQAGLKKAHDYIAMHYDPYIARPILDLKP